ncbi:uncharacterized protein [Eurosta solidaginis]|uniref:uncharacterized protein n=1 Tax=Eurosta solidaginis TaxID=178769 RepID=UPI00353175B7
MGSSDSESENGSSLTDISGGDEAARSLRVKIKQRSNLLARLQSWNAGVDEQSHTLRQLEIKLALVERHYNALEELQGKLEELDESQLEEDHRIIIEQSYIQAKTAITDRMASLQPLESPQHFSSTHISTERRQCSRTNLPKLQLTRFSGEQSDWLDFYNVFSTLVHNNKDLSDVEKFQYLRSCLTDKASRLIQSLEVTSANYKVALELIVARFNNSRLIFQAHMQHICDIQPMSSANVPTLRNFIDIVNVNLRAMQSLATAQQIGDGILLHLVSKKLDVTTRTRWEEEVSSKWGTTQSSQLRMPTWSDLATFLESRCQTFNMLGKKNQLSFVVAQAAKKCVFCNASPSHNPFNCDSFMKLDPVERYLRVKRLNLCINCLGKNHCSSNCPSHRRCQHCKVSHHTLLHRTSVEGDNSNDKLADNNQTALQATAYEGEVILATALVELCNSSGVSLTARVLLDSGSQLNFVTEHIAQHLRLPRSKSCIEVMGIGTTTTKTQYTCSLELKSLHTAYTRSIEAVILPLITSQQPTCKIDITEWKVPSNITLADDRFHKPSGIDCLIGAGVFFDLLLVGQIKLRDGLSVLQKTKLGWIVSGVAPSAHSSTVGSSNTSSSPIYKSFIATSNQPQLDHLLEKFWTLESHNESQRFLSSEERYCEEFFEATTTRCPFSKKFIVRLPFKEDPEILGRSHEIALKRLVAMEYKFSRNPSLFKQYAGFMDKYKSMSHMVNVENNPFGRYFIPHHCVLKADSSTTKLRVVFDASCRTSSGKSLNEILRVGPTLQDDIFTILVRFRSHRYVLMADIAKMYRQVLVHEADAPWQSIIWRELPENMPQAYQLQTVTYGTSSAPYLATKCLLQLAKEESTRFPIGSAVTLKDFYVDNLMTGASTINEVITIKDQVTSLLSGGGFPLRKFAANHISIIENVPQEDREEMVKLAEDHEKIHIITDSKLFRSPWSA